MTATTSDKFFQVELQSMMYAMGDCRRPFDQSALLIEGIVHGQLCHVINQAHSLVNQEQEIDACHIVLQLRLHRALIRRLIIHLRARDGTGSLKSVSTDAVEEDGAESTMVECAANETPRLKMIRDALETIDVTGELTELIEIEELEETKRKRMERMAQMAATLDQAEYLRFTEARQVSFCPSKMVKGGSSKKFKLWLTGPESRCSGYNLTNSAIEILNFLGKETVATIMDCALIIKSENPALERKSEATSMTTNSLIAQKIRQKQSGANEQYGIDVIQKLALQPWHIQEAYRRLTLTCNGPIFLNVT